MGARGLLREFRGHREPSMWINQGYFMTTMKAPTRNYGAVFKNTDIFWNQLLWLRYWLCNLLVAYRRQIGLVNALKALTTMPSIFLLHWGKCPAV